MPTDKILSPEVDAARHAAAAEKQRVRDQAQAKLAAQNKEMKKRLAATGAGTAARKASAEEKQRVKDQAQAELDAENKEMEQRVSASSAGDSTTRLSPVEMVPDATLPASAPATQEVPVPTTKALSLSDAFADSAPSEGAGGGGSVAPAAAKYLACATFVPSTSTMLSLDRKLKVAEVELVNEAEAVARVSTPTAEALQKATFVPSATTMASLDEKFKARHAAPQTTEAEAVAQNTRSIRAAEPLRAVLPPPGPPPPGPAPPRPAPPGPASPPGPRGCRAAALGVLSASGLKYSSQRGMWLPMSLVAASELSADAAAAALGAPGELPPDALPPGALCVAAKPRGKPPSFGGLSSSGLKFDPASGFWLPPGKEGTTVRAPRPDRLPLLGRLGASGLRYAPL